MTVKNAVGRPLKMDAKVMTKLIAAIQTNSNIKDACRYAGISTTTFFYYRQHNEVFKEKMSAAKQNKNKVIFSFSTYF